MAPLLRPSYLSPLNPQQPLYFILKVNSLLLILIHPDIDKVDDVSTSQLKSSLGSSLPSPNDKTDRLQCCAQCGHSGNGDSATHHNLLRCSKCKSVYYCTKECQKDHWKIHKAECNSPPVISVATSK